MEGEGVDRLAIFKALGDETRYAIYEYLAGSGKPRTTADVAAELGLHPNSIRPHLERMRDLGLVQVSTDRRGQVGRPQHRYSLAPSAPGLGVEPAGWEILARMLADVAAFMAPDPDDVAAMSWEQGRHAAQRQKAGPGRACLAALTAALDELGFEPDADGGARSANIAFTNCPFRDLAEAYPDLVCNLHRGLIEGFVTEAGGAEVTAFATLADRDPCHVDIAFASR